MRDKQTEDESEKLNMATKKLCMWGWRAQEAILFQDHLAVRDLSISYLLISISKSSQRMNDAMEAKRRKSFDVLWW